MFDLVSTRIRPPTLSGAWTSRSRSGRSCPLPFGSRTTPKSQPGGNTERSSRSSARTSSVPLRGLFRFTWNSLRCGTAHGRLRVTHRDGPDFYLTAAEREEQRDESLATASRIFLALMRHDPTARTLVPTMSDVYPWVRHLSAEEVRGFTLELVEALSDAAELDLDTNIGQVVTAWRATARIKADRADHEQAVRPTSGDFGPVDVTP